MAEDTERVVPVVIQGQRYPVRSALEPSYVAELAAYVDEKMRIASDANNTTDSLRVAVLAALNLADEVFRHRAERDGRHHGDRGPGRRDRTPAGLRAGRRTALALDLRLHAWRRT